MRVVITDSIWGEAEIERGVLESHGFEVVLAQARSPEEVVQAAQGAIALIVQYAPITAQVVEGLPDLRVVSRYGVGVDNVDVEAARARGVWVANVPDYGTEEVAVHALALILALVRRVPALDRSVREGHWDPKAAGAIPRLSELTLGLLGLGRIGRALALRARGLFGHLLGFDPFAKDWPEGVERAPSIEALLQASHVVSLHLPLTPETRGLLHRERLALMPRGSYLVNTARGGLVDLEALAWALEEGILAGAALDVLPEEPPPSDLPLLRHPRVILTPHVAWYSVTAEKELRRKAALNVLEWHQKGRPLYPVGEVERG